MLKLIVVIGLFTTNWAEGTTARLYPLYERPIWQEGLLFRQDLELPSSAQEQMCPGQAHTSAYVLKSPYVRIKYSRPYSAIISANSNIITVKKSADNSCWQQATESEGAETLAIVSFDSINGLTKAELTEPNTEIDRGGVAIYERDSLMRQGFDAVQTFYAAHHFFETYASFYRGLEFPSELFPPISANLYNPSIGYRDNAFYSSLMNSINFTTYTAGKANLARDNYTIWHELGHALHYRLGLTRAASLGEGIADFFAEVLFQYNNFGRWEESYPFVKKRRAYNKIYFQSTNEFHDAGESFGGFFVRVLNLARESNNGSEDKKTLIRHVATFAIAAIHELAEKGFTGTEMDVFVNTLREVDATDHRLKSSRNGYMASFIEKAWAERFFGSQEDPFKFTLTLTPTVGEPLTINSAKDKGTRYLPWVSAAFEPFNLNISVQTPKSLQNEQIHAELYFNGFPLQGPIDWLRLDVKGRPSATFYSEVGNALQADIEVALEEVCSSFNRRYRDGRMGCTDYGMVALYKDDDLAPFAKKRFYLEITPEKAVNVIAVQ